jgi:hypothetical protein
MLIKPLLEKRSVMAKVSIRWTYYLFPEQQIGCELQVLLPPAKRLAIGVH